MCIRDRWGDAMNDTAKAARKLGSAVGVGGGGAVGGAVSAFGLAGLAAGGLAGLDPAASLSALSVVGGIEIRNFWERVADNKLRIAEETAALELEIAQNLAADRLVIIRAGLLEAQEAAVASAMATRQRELDIIGRSSTAFLTIPAPRQSNVTRSLEASGVGASEITAILRIIAQNTTPAGNRRDPFFNENNVDSFIGELGMAGLGG